MNICCFIFNLDVNCYEIEKNIITPYISLIFIVTGISGLLMLFHIFDGYTEVVHELSGFIFVIFSILHIILNWSSLKHHFKKRIFILACCVILVFSVFIVFVSQEHNSYQRVITEGLIKAPLSNTLSVLNISYNEAENILRKNGIVIGDSKTIEEIGLRNNKFPKDILELIVE